MNRVKASIIELENGEEMQTEDVSSLVCILYAIMLTCLNQNSLTKISNVFLWSMSKGRRESRK